MHIIERYPQCYLQPHDSDDDPAIYQTKYHGISDSVIETVDVEESDNLLSISPGFNRLLLVLRDEGVMHFVKYISSSAESSRWDICNEYEIGVLEEDNS